MRVALNNGEYSLYDLAVFLFCWFHRLFYLVSRAKMGALELSMNHPRLQRWRRRRFDDEEEKKHSDCTNCKYANWVWFSMHGFYIEIFLIFMNEKLWTIEIHQKLQWQGKKSRCTAVHCLLFCVFFIFQLWSNLWMLSQNIVLRFYWLNEFFWKECFSFHFRIFSEKAAVFFNGTIIFNYLMNFKCI